MRSRGWQTGSTKRSACCERHLHCATRRVRPTTGRGSPPELGLTLWRTGHIEQGTGADGKRLRRPRHRRARCGRRDARGAARPPVLLPGGRARGLARIETRSRPPRGSICRQSSRAPSTPRACCSAHRTVRGRRPAPPGAQDRARPRSRVRGASRLQQPAATPGRLRPAGGGRADAQRVHSTSPGGEGTATGRCASLPISSRSTACSGDWDEAVAMVERDRFGRQGAAEHRLASRGVLGLTPRSRSTAGTMAREVSSSAPPARDVEPSEQERSLALVTAITWRDETQRRHLESGARRHRAPVRPTLESFASWGRRPAHLACASRTLARAASTRARLAAAAALLASPRSSGGRTYAVSARGRQR